MRDERGRRGAEEEEDCPVVCGLCERCFVVEVGGDLRLPHLR